MMKKALATAGLTVALAAGMLGGAGSAFADSTVGSAYSHSHDILVHQGGRLPATIGVHGCEEGGAFAHQGDWWNDQAAGAWHHSDEHIFVGQG